MEQSKKQYTIIRRREHAQKKGLECEAQFHHKNLHIPLIGCNGYTDNIAIGDIIRQAHLQAKERVNLVIYPKSKTIELRYNELG